MAISPLARVAVIAMFLVAVASPGPPARAAHGPACGGEWSSRDHCLLAFQGFPITVFADADVRQGNANVHVVVVMATPVGPQTIVECEASAPGYASCSEAVGEAADLFVATAPLECHVDGRGSGFFSCATAG